MQALKAPPLCGKVHLPALLVLANWRLPLVRHTLTMEETCSWVFTTRRKIPTVLLIFTERLLLVPAALVPVVPLSLMLHSPSATSCPKPHSYSITLATAFHQYSSPLPRLAPTWPPSPGSSAALPSHGTSSITLRLMVQQQPQKTSLLRSSKTRSRSRVSRLSPLTRRM